MNKGKRIWSGKNKSTNGKTWKRKRRILTLRDECSVTESSKSEFLVRYVQKHLRKRQTLTDQSLRRYWRSFCWVIAAEQDVWSHLVRFQSISVSFVMFFLWRWMMRHWTLKVWVFSGIRPKHMHKHSLFRILMTNLSTNHRWSKRQQIWTFWSNLDQKSPFWVWTSGFLYQSSLTVKAMSF